MRYLFQGFHIMFISIALCCNTITVLGQLVAHDSNGTTTTTYQNPVKGRDMIFAYNQTPAPKQGDVSLTVTNLSTFEWRLFNAATRTFEATPFFETTTDDVSTRYNNLAQGGYQIKVYENNVIVDSVVFWIYFNPGFDLQLVKDDKGAVIYTGKTCEYIDFEVNPNKPIVTSRFTYYNPYQPANNPYFLDNKLSFSIKPENGLEVSILLRSMGSEQYFRQYTPPYDNTRYTIRGWDMFGIEHTDNILYETIIPHAKMTVVLPEKDPQSAPVDVRFVGKESTNAMQFTWKFGTTDPPESYPLDELPDTVKYTYYIPKNAYSAVLTVKSANGCLDSISEKIIVAPSFIDVPNVFTPNGDGLHDHFKIENTSIQKFEISIYNRAGLRVYHYKGENLHDWEGWDGRYKGKDMEEGVYFFIVTATGWDGETYKDSKKSGEKKYTGSLQLYR